MKKVNKQLRQVGVVLVALVSLGAAAPATTADAATRTVPQALRKTWFAWGGESGLHRVKITAKTLTDSFGLYQHGKWVINGTQHTLRLGKKVKKNKTFTISKKPDKKGFYTLRVKFTYSDGTLQDGNVTRKIKRIKVKGKTRLKIQLRFPKTGTRTDTYLPITKEILTTTMN
ncbi:hypothetical protein [Levilactobacillus yiduensis]|uniref:hypothetical protein n=1 Tax=Levilactobacillus yiduensis TaxID=2953880 RepID=UPI000EF295D0|nr:hypothetical protein [Levilactobacillus yiduensis]AYM01911.1 hypothetical protein D8911_02470 [Levilactobacillus brevis]